MKQEYTYSSNTPDDIRDLWQTPRPYFDFFNTVMGYNFECDVAAADYNHLCQKYFTEEDNSLVCDWTKSNWCNPPYSDIGPWVEKAIEECEKGNKTVMLVPSNIDTKWFMKIIAYKRARVVFLVGGRIKFIRADTQEPVGSNPRGSMFIEFVPDQDFSENKMSYTPNHLYKVKKDGKEAS
ncbi:adenine methyltransferase [Aeromonas phage BUCT695]|uniref:adenine methyltransferase n=1 Tax=Aeromonas phage BUCT695 TaxID=2908630 RepID=UPI00232905B9|nr:adenine methyltransferase [Aeromonas phage BUCT695]UIW10571.1 adenine methyltransferase [Aeromonas phage BUCT695]